jgi:uncharacterized coiled-coil DUF342 family protein
MTTRRTLRYERDTARRQRDDMTEQRDDAVKDAEIERFNVKRLSAQLSDARDALRKAPRPVAPAPDDWQAERRDLRRELMLTKRARAALVDQVEELRACNHAYSREAMSRAGTLATAGEVTAP